MASLDDGKEWRTFEEWRELRYWVRKGEKATWFDDVPKFSLFQVEEDFEDEDQGWGMDDWCSIY